MSTIVTRASKGLPLTWNEADNNFNNLNYGSYVSVKDSAYGAKGDGVTDDTAAIQAAIDSLGSGGGIILITGKHYVASNLTVKPNCFLVGNAKMPGASLLGSGSNTDYVLQNSCIRLASTATIKLKGGAGLSSLMIYRYGMTFPAANSSAYAGTAVTMEGDDASVMHCFIMGFNKAIYSNGPNRPRISYLYHDNTNGIEIASCWDIPYINNCHAWPWATVATVGDHTVNERAGTAYYLHSGVDWARITDCFSYGYMTGFYLDSINSTVLKGCGADNTYNTTPLHTGSKGFVISGTSRDTVMIGCQAAAQETAGFFIETPDNAITLINGCSSWGCGTHGMLIQNGDVTVIGGLIRTVNNGLTIDDPLSKVTVIGTTFAYIVGKPITVLQTNTNIQLHDLNLTNNTGIIVDALATSPSISSTGGYPVLPSNGDVFTITGTTNFGSLQHGWKGRQVTLIFADSLNVFSGTGTVANMRLNNNVSFVTAANSTLTLKHDGTQWFEIGRCV